MARKVLVIAPHGLDEALGCGGTMARHADEGDEVHVLIVCGNGTGRDAARRINAHKASQILSAMPPRFAGFPENRSDTVPLGDMVGAIERCAAELTPEVIYVSHGGNLNIDHQRSFRAALTALRPVPGLSVRAIYTYEILSSTDWAPPAWEQRFEPCRFVEITAQLERKMSALEAYGEEMRPAPHARSPDGVLALARLRGGTVGYHAAEAFAVVRESVAA